MKFRTISTGSKGNGYVLIPDRGRCLLIEAGVSRSEMLKAIDFDLSRIAGCLISHCHGDHEKYAGHYEQYGIPVHRMYQTEGASRIEIDDWKVMAVPVNHDVPNRMFLIQHPEIRVMYITDTDSIPVQWAADAILIEANYDLDVLNEKTLNGQIPTIVRNRVIQSHMAIDTATDYLKGYDPRTVRKIVLIHLSDKNSKAEEFRTRIEKDLGIPTEIAIPGQTVRL